MNLIRQKYNYHVSLDTVEEFEQIILLDSTISEKSEIIRKASKIMFLLWKLFSKYNFLSGEGNNSITKPKLKTEKKKLFAVLMGADFSKCFPYFLFSTNKNLYLFDAWPKEQDGIIKFLNAFKVNNVFFTSSQVVKIIQSKTPNTNCVWVPEGINPEMYKYYDYRDKTIDVLALGRRYDTYHKQIVDCLKNNDKIYLYE